MIAITVTPDEVGMHRERELISVWSGRAAAASLLFSPLGYPSTKSLIGRHKVVRHRQQF